MRMLLAIYKYFPWGGLQKDAFRIAEEAVRRGHEVHVLAAEWTGAAPEGVVLERTGVRGLSNHGRMRSFARRFLGRLARGDVQVSLAMSRIPGADFHFAADDCLRIHLPERHPAWILRLLPRYRVFLDLEAAVFAGSSPTRILYIAEPQRRDYREAYHVPEDRFIALPPGMDPRCRRPDDAAEIRRRIRAGLHLDDDAIVFILVASGFRLKGGDRALAALASLPRELRERCRMLVVGKVDRTEAGRCAAALGLEKQLILAGPRDDVPDFLLAADIMVHPARQESAGSVLVEAIASGLPVICSGVCGFAPYVEASSGLVLREPFRQEELDRVLPGRLAGLEESARRTLEYARTQDFCRRAAAVVDRLEEFVRSRAV